MKPAPRQIVLACALAATTAASLWVAREESPEDITEVQDRPEQASPGSEAGSKLLAERIRRGEVLESEVDPFRAKSWYVAPPEPPPPPPPKPTAPPLPFRYIGMFEDKGKTTIFLARGDESFAVTAGETFAGAYKLEKVEPDRLVFNYLPLPTQQTLLIGTNQ